MYQKQFAEYFDKHMEEILRDLDEIIFIESVGDINAPVKPFGEGSRKALNWGKAYLEKLRIHILTFSLSLITPCSMPCEAIIFIPFKWQTLPSPEASAITIFSDPISKDAVQPIICYIIF